MEARALNMLARIGEHLDQHVFPCVANGGFVVLNDSAVPSTESTEKDHARQKQTGSTAGSRKGTTGWQGPAGGTRSSSDAASLIGSDSQTQYEVELRALDTHYPGARLWHQEDGFWILTPSQLLHGNRRHAMFLTGISFQGRSVRSWAFWVGAIAFPEWIGPRHTNFPDGSVCAFEPLDGTWIFGDPIVQLLDIYTLWALRHLYLREFGRWPGYQCVHFPGERLLELRGDEHCGCGSGKRLYADCCMPSDLAGNRIAMLLDFAWATGGVRRPPHVVERFVRSQQEPPSLRDLVTPFAMQPIQLIGIADIGAPFPKRAHNQRVLA